MITCPQCQTRHEAGTRFCSQCGSRLPVPPPADSGDTVMLPPEALPRANKTGELRPFDQDVTQQVPARPMDGTDPDETVRVTPSSPSYNPPPPSYNPPPPSYNPPPPSYNPPPPSYNPPPPSYNPPPPTTSIPVGTAKKGPGWCMILGIIGVVIVVLCGGSVFALYLFGQQFVRDSGLGEILPSVIAGDPGTLLPSVIPGDPGAILAPAGEVIVEETFDDPERSIFTPGESDVASYQLEDGGYSIDVRETNYISLEPINETLDDVTFSIDATITGPTDAAAALIFRQADDSNFYIFNVRNDGTYNLEIYGQAGDAEATPLIDWTAHPAITDGTNRLTVQAVGPAISLSVNGVVVGGISDATIERGTLAIAVNTFDGGGAKVLFDNLIVAR